MKNIWILPNIILNHFAILEIYGIRSNKYGCIRSYYKLSYRAGISNSIISDFKRGKVKEPTISSIIHICEGFGIELKDFFDSPYFKDVEAIDRFDK